MKQHSMNLTKKPMESYIVNFPKSPVYFSLELETLRNHSTRQGQKCCNYATRFEDEIVFLQNSHNS